MATKVVGNRGQNKQDVCLGHIWPIFGPSENNHSGYLHKTFIKKKTICSFYLITEFGEHLVNYLTYSNCFFLKL